MSFAGSVQNMFGTDTLGKAPFELNAQQRRIREAYNTRWAFYIGRQVRYNEPPGEAQIVVNLVRALTDKGNDFLFGKGFDFKGNPDVWPFFESVIKKVWSGTKKELFGLELGQMGGVTGDAYVKTWWDEKWKCVRYSILSSASVVPIWDPMRTGKDRRMLECRVVRMVEEQTQDSPTNEPDKVYYTTIYRPNFIQQYRNSNLIIEQENPMGEIPIVHIQNLPLSGSNEGVSDVEDILKIQEEINTKLTAISSIIDYHEAPTTLAYGIQPQQMTKGPNNIWYLPPKDGGHEVENLEAHSDLTSSNTFLQTLREMGHELTGVPEASLGKEQAISNTSGVALHMQFLPMMQRTDRKRATYGEGIIELSRLGVKLSRIFDPQAFEVKIGSSIENASEVLESMFPKDTQIKVDVDPDGTDWKALELEVGWGNVLPKDQLMELEKVRAIKDMGLIPDRICLKILVDSGVVDAAAIGSVEECIEEAKAEVMEKSQMEFATQMGYGMEPMGGSPGGESSPEGSKMKNWQEKPDAAGKEQSNKKSS